MVITGRNWRRLRPRGLPASTAWCDPSICPGASSCCDPCICCIRRARSALGTTSRKARAEEEVWRAEVFCLMPPSIGEATVLRLDQVSKNRERNCRNNWFVELVVACMLYFFFVCIFLNILNHFSCSTTVPCLRISNVPKDLLTARDWRKRVLTEAKAYGWNCSNHVRLFNYALSRWVEKRSRLPDVFAHQKS